MAVREVAAERPVAIACDVCGSDAARVVLSATDHREQLGGTFQVVRCCGCDLARTVPRPDDLAPWYPETYLNHAARPPLTVRAINYGLRVCAAPGSSEPLARLVGWVIPNADVGPAVPARARVLDVGAGNGSAVHAMRACGLDAWGIEPSPAGVAAAHAAGVGTVLQGTLGSAEIPKGPWDLIRFTHVLEHVPSPTSTLKVARQLLAPGGRVVVLVPNFDGFGRRLFGQAWDGLEVPRHLHHFTSSTLTRTLQSADFDVASIRSVALFGVLPASIDAVSAGGERQRGWGRSLVVRGIAYPFELLLAAVGGGDGLVAIATPSGAGPR